MLVCAWLQPFPSLLCCLVASLLFLCVAPTSCFVSHPLTTCGVFSHLSAIQFLTAVIDYAKKSLATVQSGHVSTTFSLQSHGNTIGEYPQQVRAEFSLAPVMPLAMTLLMVTSGSFANVRVPTSGRLEVLLAGTGAWGGCVVLRFLVGCIMVLCLLHPLASCVATRGFVRIPSTYAPLRTYPLCQQARCTARTA